MIEFSKQQPPPRWSLWVRIVNLVAQSQSRRMIASSSNLRFDLWLQKSTSTDTLLLLLIDQLHRTIHALDFVFSRLILPSLMLNLENKIMKLLPLNVQRCLVVVTNWNREILNPIGSSWFPDNLRRGFHFPAAPAKFPNNLNDRFYLPTVQCSLADFPAVSLICKFVYSILPPYTGCAKNPNGLLVLWAHSTASCCMVSTASPQ